MSDTPRTDAMMKFCFGTDQEYIRLADAVKLERELTESQHRIRTLIEERDSARIQAEHKWKLREEFEALIGTNDVSEGVKRIKELMKKGNR